MSSVDSSIKSRLLTREDPFLREVSLTGVTAATVKFLNTATKVYEDQEEKKRLWYVEEEYILARLDDDSRFFRKESSIFHTTVDPNIVNDSISPLYNTTSFRTFSKHSRS